LESRRGSEAESDGKTNKNLKILGGVFKRIFVPTEKLAPTGKVGAYGKSWRQATVRFGFVRA
jgi:hypothetical protein